MRIGRKDMRKGRGRNKIENIRCKERLFKDACANRIQYRGERNIE